jgi:3-deoxy-D-manno-octulosonic-acid transferase
MLRRLTFLGIQTHTIADRFLALGAPKEKIEILPTLKYDNAYFSDTLPGQQELAQAMGLNSDHVLFVAGSTAPGEEDTLLTAYLTLQKSHPTLRLAIAPRKPESLPALLAALKERNLTPILRTTRPDASTSIENQKSKIKNHEVFILDTLGELKKLYALAAFAFIGRSLVKLGGSDMIEAAALAKPCCFGPYTSNFAEVVELLLQENAAVLTPDEPTLTRTLANWMANPEEAAAMGRHARQIIQQQRGSTDRYVQKLMQLLKLPPAPGPLAADSVQQPRNSRSPEAHVSQNGSDGSLAHRSSDHP